jgi:hypothetical protein
MTVRILVGAATESTLGKRKMNWKESPWEMTLETIPTTLHHNIRQTKVVRRVVSICSTPSLPNKTHSTLVRTAVSNYFLRSERKGL